MALIIHSSSCLIKKPHLLLHKVPLLLSPTKPSLLSIKSQDSTTQPPKPTITGQPADDTSSNLAPPPKKSSSSGLGFGSSSSSSSGKSIPDPVSTKKKQKGRGERASVIRRSPVEKPGFVLPQEEAQSKEQSRNESAFLLAWLGLGSIILVEGIALAASGFLPKEWDQFLVKYLYPSFTPTVFLFVAGTVVYGVLKYLQNEKLNGPNDRS